MSHLRVPALTVVAVLFSITAACAQSAGPLEAVGPDGAVLQPVVQPTALTPVQRSALYNTASRQHIQARAGEVTAAVGTTVPPAIELGSLPAVPTLGDNPDNVLKYATVERNLVVVDPIRMRVVEVIHPGAGPQ